MSEIPFLLKWADPLEFWERLMVNVGVVLVFGAFYLRFLKRP
jgi:hypothetical protein